MHVFINSRVLMYGLPCAARTIRTSARCIQVLWYDAPKHMCTPRICKPYDPSTAADNSMSSHMCYLLLGNGCEELFLGVRVCEWPGTAVNCTPGTRLID